MTLQSIRLLAAALTVITGAAIHAPSAGAAGVRDLPRAAAPAKAVKRPQSVVKQKSKAISPGRQTLRTGGRTPVFRANGTGRRTLNTRGRTPLRFNTTPLRRNPSRRGGSRFRR